MLGKMLKSTDGGESVEETRQPEWRGKEDFILSLKAKILLICSHAKKIRNVYDEKEPKNKSSTQYIKVHELISKM